MLIAGIKKSNTQGANTKNLSKLAYPKLKMLLSSKTNKKMPLISRNKIIEMYPIRLLKN
jgi:hypothetical protein